MQSLFLSDALFSLLSLNFRNLLSQTLPSYCMYCILQQNAKFDVLQPAQTSLCLILYCILYISCWSYWLVPTHCVIGTQQSSRLSDHSLGRWFVYTSNWSECILIAFGALSLTSAIWEHNSSKLHSVLNSLVITGCNLYCFMCHRFGIAYRHE